MNVNLRDAKIRRLTVLDVDEVFELLRAVYSSPEFPLGGRWSRQTVQSVIEADSSFGIFCSHRLSAILLMRGVNGVWDIDIMATHPRFQRQGHMKFLLGSVLEQKPEQTEVWLEVHEKNLGAANFYKKLGFQQVGVRPGYYHDGSAAHLMNFR